MSLQFIAEGHRYILDGQPIPNVTTILMEAGVIDATWYQESGVFRGSAVHTALQYFDRDELDIGSVDPDFMGYLMAYKKFRSEMNCTWKDIETPVFNSLYRYACMPDRVGHINGIPAVLELKTGKPHPATALQTAAQAACYYDPLARYALELRKDGSYRLTRYDDPNDLRVFLGCLAVTTWKKNNVR